MNQSNLRLIGPMLFFLILAIGFGCASNKSGIIYRCDDGKKFEAEFYDKADIVFLTVSGRTSSLHRISSASGEKKYTDGNTILWIKGGSASIETYGQTEFKNCSPKAK